MPESPSVAGGLQGLGLAQDIGQLGKSGDSFQNLAMGQQGCGLAVLSPLKIAGVGEIIAVGGRVEVAVTPATQGQGIDPIGG